jgi:hypothetical protein
MNMVQDGTSVLLIGCAIGAVVAALVPWYRTGRRVQREGRPGT